MNGKKLAISVFAVFAAWIGISGGALSYCRAQSSNAVNDYFGGSDDDEDLAQIPVKPIGGIPGQGDADARKLMGTGSTGAAALSGTGAAINKFYTDSINGVKATPIPTPGWGDFNTIQSDKSYNDDYDVRMKEELSKPLPKHDPFGDSLDEIEEKLRPVDK